MSLVNVRYRSNTTWKLLLFLLLNYLIIIIKQKRCIYLNLATKKQLETNGPFSSYVRDIESENSEIERLKC